MIRRNFMQGILAMSLIPSSFAGSMMQIRQSKLLKPEALKLNDTVGIIAPGTAVSDPLDIEKAKEAIEHLGLKAIFAEHVLTGHGYKSRTIEERLEDLNSMFLNDDVKGIFCIRGGYGSGQLLDVLDYDLIRSNPKIFVGYSDITALHLAINRKAGLVTFHGPVLLSGFSSYTMKQLKKALFNTDPIGLLANPDEKSGEREKFPVFTVSSGIAKGRLTGGNLSLITSLMGTPFEIDTKNSILFLEDVGEEPYRIDRMLTQLRLAGKLNANGIVFGLCAGCDSSGLRVWDYSLGEVLENILGDLGIPVFYGLMIGHTFDQLTLPYGVMAEMDADRGFVNIVETCVE